MTLVAWISWISAAANIGMTIYALRLIRRWRRLNAAWHVLVLFAYQHRQKAVLIEEIEAVRRTWDQLTMRGR